MRVLFSGVPAFGHLLPLVPFIRSATAQGHAVAVVSSAVMGAPLAVELPDVPFFAAGPDAAEIVSEVGRRHPGADPVNDPQLETVVDFFAGARLDLAFEETLAAAEQFAPDFLIVDEYDYVGPLVAAAIGVPHATVALGSEVPAMILDPMVELARARYEERGLTMRSPVGVLDPTPPSLQAPGWSEDPLTVPYHSVPYSRGVEVDTTPREDGTRPRVLLTLGTVFNDRAILADIVSSVAELDVDVVATLGVQLDEPPVLSSNVRYERFRPLAELLPGVQLVVTAGGSGSVLAATSRAIPMVILPQGANQFMNATLAEGAGIAVVVPDATAVGQAVSRVLADPNIHAASRRVADEMSSRPGAEEALAQILRTP